MELLDGVFPLVCNIRQFRVTLFIRVRSECRNPLQQAAQINAKVRCVLIVGGKVVTHGIAGIWVWFGIKPCQQYPGGKLQLVVQRLHCLIVFESAGKGSAELSLIACVQSQLVQWLGLAPAPLAYASGAHLGSLAVAQIPG